MSVLMSHLSISSFEFRLNAEFHRALASELRRRLELARQGGGERFGCARRRRANCLCASGLIFSLHPGSPFLELSPLAGGRDAHDALGAGIVTGIGLVKVAQATIVASYVTAEGGRHYPLTVKKHFRAQEIAEENFLPCIYLVDWAAVCPPGPGVSRCGPLWDGSFTTRRG